jgi:hypothetical protein
MNRNVLNRIAKLESERCTRAEQAIVICASTSDDAETRLSDMRSSGQLSSHSPVIVLTGVPRRNETWR